MNRNVFGAFIHDAPGAKFSSESGGHNTMWSSDYPHSETSYPKSHELLDELFSRVSPEVKQAIVCDRARQVFDI